MLTLVSVTNARGDTLQLPLLDSSAGYVVQDIEGLGPVNATLTSSALAQVDGATFQNAQRVTRNITMTLGYSPDFVTNTVQSLRSSMYDYLLTKENVSLGFYMDGALFAVAAGQVESNTNTLFSADPANDISIICYDPDFYSPEVVSSSLETVSDTSVNTISYPGSTEAGVIFTLSIDRDDLTSFTLYNTAPDNTQQKMAIEGSFSSGDVVTINTIPGSKAVTLLRDGIKSSILFALDPNSSWISLSKGNNSFRCFAAGDEIPYTLAYTPKYGAL
jgi:hypothetical protein